MKRRTFEPVVASGDKGRAAPKAKADPALERLWKEALRARKASYSPYSKFAVGAALIADGELYSGCNVENASYGGAICAERVAILKAVSEGRRRLQRLVVVAEGPRPVPPCGICLQTIAEFGSPGLEIWLASPKGLQEKVALKDLLPKSFGPSDLKR